MSYDLDEEKPSTAYRAPETTEERKVRNAYNRELKARWVAEGRCVRCRNRADPTFTTCTPCREKERAYKVARYREKHPAPYVGTCTACGQSGHQRLQCPGAPAIATVGTCTCRTKRAELPPDVPVEPCEYHRKYRRAIRRRQAVS